MARGNTNSTGVIIPKIIKLTSQTIPASSWTSGSGVTDYDYYYDITVSGADSTMTPIIVFDISSAVSGNLAPLCESRSNSVRVFAKDNLSDAVVVESITLIGG